MAWSSWRSSEKLRHTPEELALFISNCAMPTQFALRSMPLVTQLPRRAKWTG